MLLMHDLQNESASCMQDVPSLACASWPYINNHIQNGFLKLRIKDSPPASTTTSVDIQRTSLS